MSLLRFAIAMIAVTLAANVMIQPTLAANAQVKKAQELLLKLGYEVGEPDGAWGSKTRSALNEFQKQQGFKTTRRLSSGAVAALEIVAEGSKKLEKSPWSLQERIGNTLVLDNGTRVHYSKSGGKIVRTKKGKVFRKNWIKKSDGTYCEYLFGLKRMVCGDKNPEAYVMYPDTKDEGAFVFFDIKSGARRFSSRLVSGNKLKP